MCFEPFASAVPPHDEALACPHGHSVCVQCVARLVTPTDRCGDECSGLQYRCPLCRHSVCVTHLHMLVMLKGSWSKALGCFKCHHLCQAWMHRQSLGVDTSTTEDEDEDEAEA